MSIKSKKALKRRKKVVPQAEQGVASAQAAMLAFLAKADPQAVKKRR